MIEPSVFTPVAAVNVSTSMANTTFSRVCAENTGASLVLAAVNRLTAMIKPTSPVPPPDPSARLPLMSSSCQRRFEAMSPPRLCGLIASNVKRR
jgi:hypothetical protein